MTFPLPRPIDFAAALRPPEKTPDPQLARAVRRRAACLREAAEVLRHLPGPGEALHGVMSGRYDLADLLSALLDKLGPATLIVATLSFSERNVTDLLAWLDSGKVTGLTLLTSEFFREHNRGLFDSFRASLKERGGRLTAARNHCKVACIGFTDGRRLSLEGSANLRSNSNWEQFCLADSPELYAFHSRWILDRVDRHEIDQGGNPQAG